MGVRTNAQCCHVGHLFLLVLRGATSLLHQAVHNIYVINSWSHLVRLVIGCHSADGKRAKPVPLEVFPNTASLPKTAMSYVKWFA